MQNNTKTVMAAFAAVLVLCSLPLFSSGAEADTIEYDQDLGQKYSYSLQFVFSGSDASSILWDFGDGLTSEEWNPQHTYAAVGVYYVTQTAYNSYQGGSQSVAVYRVEIVGFPVLTFDTGSGSTVADLQQTAYGVVAIQPANPVKEDYYFVGWFKDPGCEEPYDWTQQVKMSMTLYAGWEYAGTNEPDPEPEPEPTSDNAKQFPYWLIPLALTIIAALYAIFRDGDDNLVALAVTGTLAVATIGVYIVYGGGIPW
jgi:uncharacterized repeat protein (TIGR02543 family)